MTLATDTQSMNEFAWNYGQDNTEAAWLLDPRDAWVKNPHYRGPAVSHPEDDCPSNMPTPDGLISDPAAAAAFMFAGNATFTLRSLKTGTRYTYRVRVAKDNDQMYFISTLVGSDNETDYEYLGFINAERGPDLCAGKKGNPLDVRYKALAWFLRSLLKGQMPADAEFWHEGRCARCARKLTDPESIARGLGPECATKV